MNCSKRVLAYALLAAAWSGPLRAQDIRSVLLAAPLKDEEPKEAPAAWQGVTKKAQTGARYVLPTGFTFLALTEVKIFSFNTQTPCIAVVERDVVYLNRVVIPKGTRVIGTVAVEKSHDRIIIRFHHIILPTGDELVFSGLALSLDGSAGLKGDVVSQHKDSAVASTVLRGLVTGTQAVLDATVANPVTSQAAQGLSQEALRELDTERQQVTTSITVNNQTGLRIYVNQRLEY